MGGSGGNYSPPRKTSVDCGDIKFVTVINSPRNISLLNVKDLLSLEKNSAHELVFKTLSGTEVGKLFSSQLLKIASCIESGFGYSAVVEDISADVCKVEVFCSKNPRQV